MFGVSGVDLRLVDPMIDREGEREELPERGSRDQVSGNKASSTNKVFRGSITVTMPDKTKVRYPLPSTRGSAVGAMCNIMVTLGAHIVIAWFKRVKGGWEFQEEGAIVSSRRARA